MRFAIFCAAVLACALPAAAGAATFTDEVLMPNAGTSPFTGTFEVAVDPYLGPGPVTSITVEVFYEFFGTQRFNPGREGALEGSVEVNAFAGSVNDDEFGLFSFAMAGTPYTITVQNGDTGFDVSGSVSETLDPITEQEFIDDIVDGYQFVAGYSFDLDLTDNLTAGSLGSRDFTARATYRLTYNTSPAIPEPAAWAMMIAGFGLVGGGMRVSRTAAQRAAA